MRQFDRFILETILIYKKYIIKYLYNISNNFFEILTIVCSIKDKIQYRRCLIIVIINTVYLYYQ